MHVSLQGDEKPRGFFAFAVWNYEDEKVQVFQFSQAGLIDPIINALSDEEIGQSPMPSISKSPRTGKAVSISGTTSVRTRQASSTQN